MTALATLLGQYGDYGAMTDALGRWQRGSKKKVPQLLLIALKMSGDTRYLTPFKVALNAAQQEYELESLRSWMDTVRRDEADALRREIADRIARLENQ